MKSTILAILFIFAGFNMNLSAQETPAKAVISGTVKTTTGENLSMASIQLLDTQSNKVQNVIFSDAEGKFLIPDIPAGKYTVRISYVGYLPSYRTVSISSTQQIAVLGETCMALQETMLSEVVVYGQLPVSK